MAKLIPVDGYIGLVASFFIILNLCELIKPSGAMMNCLTPSMFKTGKVGYPTMTPIYVPPSGERATWYPQYQQQILQSHYAMANMNPLTRLFQPKPWKSPMFGLKRWADGWRMGLNPNYYKPNPYAFNPNANVPAVHNFPGYSSEQQSNPSTSTYYNNQLSSSGQLIPTNYGSSSSSQLLNGGWSLPLGPSGQLIGPGGNTQQQQQYTQQPNYDNPTSNPYSGTKGSSVKTTTRKRPSVLIADGGFDSYDALLNKYHNYNQYGSPLISGYSYPSWYSKGAYVDPRRMAPRLDEVMSPRA